MSVSFINFTSLNVIQVMTSRQIKTPVAAAGRLALPAIMLNKNNPNIPPAKIPESFHQASSTLQELSTPGASTTGGPD